MQQQTKQPRPPQQGFWLKICASSQSRQDEKVTASGITQATISHCGHAKIIWHKQTMTQ
jgi:hypothetical protein